MGGVGCGRERLGASGGGFVGRGLAAPDDVHFLVSVHVAVHKGFSDANEVDLWGVSECCVYVGVWRLGRGDNGKEKGME